MYTAAVGKPRLSGMGEEEDLSRSRPLKPRERKTDLVFEMATEVIK